MFSFPCELSGVTYLFTFRWNDREQVWHLLLSDGDGDAIASCAVLLNVAMFAGVADDRAPPGYFFAIDLDGAGTDPAYTDLGRRVAVTFVPFSEL